MSSKKKKETSAKAEKKSKEKDKKKSKKDKKKKRATPDSDADDDTQEAPQRGSRGQMYAGASVDDEDDGIDSLQVSPSGRVVADGVSNNVAAHLLRRARLSFAFSCFRVFLLLFNTSFCICSSRFSLTCKCSICLLNLYIYLFMTINVCIRMDVP